MSHECPRNGCATLVSSGKLMCGPCWKLVPAPLQNALYRAWDHGKGAGSQAHRAAMKAAIRAVNGEPEPALRMRPGDQPLPEPGTGPSMHDLVCEDIRTRWASGIIGAAPLATAIDAVTASLQERKRIGLERYGSILQAGNGRDALRDLREELEDAVVYCRQVIEEGRLDREQAADMRIMHDALIASLFRVHEAQAAGAC